MDHLIVCAHCAATNRLPEARPASAAKCGKCGAALFEGHPADVSGEIFTRQIERSTIPVLVDVWAPWCAPCRMMAPAFAAAAAELEPQVRLVKLNSDVEQAVAAQLGISGIPTLLLFRGGREIARQSGAMSASQIVQWTKQHL
jgi:thioredoxin 2